MTTVRVGRRWEGFHSARSIPWACDLDLGIHSRARWRSSAYRCSLVGQAGRAQSLIHGRWESARARMGERGRVLGRACEIAIKTAGPISARAR